MSFDARCPQCVFVSRQLGQSTPCLLHVSLTVPAERTVADEAGESVASSQDYDEPFVFGQVRPTVDRPGPFTVREYVRLALLRSRIQEERRSRGEGELSMLVRGVPL
jgi:hypothetical protein